MKAYTVVGPTNDQPRFFKSFDNANDSGDVAIVSNAAWVSFFGRLAGAGS